MNLRLLALSLGSLLLGTVAHAQPVKVQEDFGLPSVSALAPVPTDFHPVAGDALRSVSAGTATAPRTDSVRSSGASASVDGHFPVSDSGAGRVAKPVLDRRLDSVRTPDRSDPKDPVVRVGNATAVLLTGVASTTFGLCYWKFHSRINRQIEDTPLNGLGLMIAATLAIPVGVVLTWSGIVMLF